LTLDKATNENYKYSLPNKVFDYIHTETPIIATNIIEVARVIRENNVGVVLNEFTINSLTNSIKELQQNKERVDQLKNNCKIAAEKENWEKEVAILKEIYPSLVK